MRRFTGMIVALMAAVAIVAIGASTAEAAQSQVMKKASTVTAMNDIKIAPADAVQLSGNTYVDVGLMHVLNGNSLRTNIALPADITQRTRVGKTALAITLADVGAPADNALRPD